MVRLNRIYTRTGDDGTTGLVDGSRVSKTAPRMHAIGDVDELNSAIGVAIGLVEPGLAAKLTRIQNELFDCGADLATPAAIDGALRVVASQVDRLEAEIDAMNADLSPLTSFVLPAGEPGAASLHLARAIARRAERAGVAMAQDEPASGSALAYLNRLSDWLFVAARTVNQSGAGDVLWQPGATR